MAVTLRQPLVQKKSLPRTSRFCRTTLRRLDHRTPIQTVARRRETTTMAKASEARVLRALLRSNFTAFVRKVFTTLEPGQAFVPNWHLDAIAYQLERVGRGEIDRKSVV